MPEPLPCLLALPVVKNKPFCRRDTAAAELRSGLYTEDRSAMIIGQSFYGFPGAFQGVLGKFEIHLQSHDRILHDLSR